MTADRRVANASDVASTLPATIAPTRRNIEILTAAKTVLAAALAVTAARDAARHADPFAAAGFRPGPVRVLSWWRWRLAALFVAIDVAAVLCAWLLVPIGPSPVAPIIVALVTVFAANLTDLHRSRLELSVLEELPAYLLVAAAGCATALGVAAARETHDLAVGRCFLFAATELALFAAARLIVYTTARGLRRSRRIAHAVLIVGVGDVAERLATAMLAHPEYGLAPVGFIDPDGAAPNRRLPLPVLGSIETMPYAMVEHGVSNVVFAFSSAPDAQLVRVVRACVRLDCQVFVVPRFFELYGADRRAHVEVIWGVPLVRLRRWPLRPSHTLIKRGTDIALSGLALLVLSPVFAACALAVRLADGKGVIFKQVRIGADDQPFTLYKFRSMRPVDEAEQTTRWSIDGDERIGRVGRFLRRTGLDELPQLVNILRGDMSVVGPRPERPHFAATFGAAVSRYRLRHRVAAGLTGLAQVNGLRGDTSIDDRVTFDNYYIDTWSFWTDIKIMLRTLRTVFRREEPDGVVDFTGGLPEPTRTR